VCFSPGVDGVAGLVIAAVGVDALRRVRRPAERPLAALPAVFAAHQLVEVFVWWGLQGRVPSAVGHSAAWVYLVIAFGVLPILVPVAVGALEPAAHLRRTGALVALGTAVAVALTFAVVRGPVEATVAGHCIAYHVPLWHGGALAFLYVLATCGSLLVSDHGLVRRWGLVNLAAVLVLVWVNRVGFISLWCVWAAVTSVAIAAYLRQAPAPVELEQTGPTSPA
jgi:uncharacterized protein DUF6629